MSASRLSLAEQRAVAALAAGVRGALGLRAAKICLFGSRARGEGRDDSDLDVLVEVAGSTRADRRLIVDLAADLSLEHHLILSPLVTDLGALDGTPLGARIASDGVAL